MVDVFRIHILPNLAVRPPINALAAISFFHRAHEDIFLLGVSKDNVPCALVFEAFSAFTKFCVDTFGRLDEAACRANFTLLLEVLDGG